MNYVEELLNQLVDCFQEMMKQNEEYRDSLYYSNNLKILETNKEIVDNNNITEEKKLLNITTENIVTEENKNLHPLPNKPSLRYVTWDSSKKNLLEQKFRACTLALDSILGQTMIDKALQICTVSWKPSATNFNHSLSRDKMLQESRKTWKLTKIVSETSKRQCWHIAGENKKIYLCIEGFCSCRAFIFALETNFPICKHILAVKISERFGDFNKISVSDEQYPNYLTTIE